MKTEFLGEHGHLAIGTNSINRAIAYFTVRIKPEWVSFFTGICKTAKEKDGRVIAVYLDKEISGFAIHLLQK